MKHKATQFLKNAPIFQVNLDINELDNSIKDIKSQQYICDKDLGEDKQAQVFSGQWVDRNGKKLLFYLAERWANDTVQVEVSKI